MTRKFTKIIAKDRFLKYYKRLLINDLYPSEYFFNHKNIKIMSQLKLLSLEFHSMYKYPILLF